MPSRFRGPPAWLLIDAAFKLAGLALALCGWPLGVSVIVAFAAVPWLVFQLLAPSGRLFGPVVTSFCTERREVWLTIDDGPDAASTPPMLDLLDRHGAQATFFLIGRKLAGAPEWAREIVRRGHTVGNHSFSHPSLTFWCAAPSRIAAEIDRTSAEFQRAGLPPPPWFRPPVGMKSPFLAGALARRGLTLLLWNARGFDGTGRDARAAFARMLPHIRPGAILLAHEGGRNPDARLAFVALLLEHLAREGYRCVVPPAESLRNLGGVTRPATFP